MDELATLAGALVSLVFEPFVEPEPVSAAFFSDEPFVASVPFDSPFEDDGPLDAPSLGRESVR